MNEELLRAIFENEGFAEKGKTFEEFVADMESSPELQQAVFDNAGFAEKGKTIDQFRSDLGGGQPVQEVGAETQPTPEQGEVVGVGREQLGPSTAKNLLDQTLQVTEDKISEATGFSNIWTGLKNLVTSGGNITQAAIKTATKVGIEVTPLLEELDQRIDELPDEIATLDLESAAEDIALRQEDDSQEEVTRKAFKDQENHLNRLSKIQDRRKSKLTGSELAIANAILEGKEVNLPEEASEDFTRWTKAITSQMGQNDLNKKGLGKYSEITRIASDSIIQSKDNKDFDHIYDNALIAIGNYLDENPGKRQDAQIVIDELLKRRDEGALITTDVTSTAAATLASSLSSTVGAVVGWGKNLFADDATNSREDLAKATAKILQHQVSNDLERALALTTDSKASGSVISQRVVLDNGDRMEIVDGKVIGFVNSDGYKVNKPRKSTLAQAARYEKLSGESDEAAEAVFGKTQTNVNGRSLFQNGANVIAQMAPIVVSGGTAAGVIAATSSVSLGGLYEAALEETGDIDKAFLFAAVTAPAIGFVESKIGGLEKRVGSLFTTVEKNIAKETVEKVTKDFTEESIKKLARGETPGNLMKSLRDGFIQNSKGMPKDIASELVEEMSNIPVELMTRGILGLETEAPSMNELLETALITAVVSGPIGFFTGGGSKNKKSYFEMMGAASLNLDLFNSESDKYINQEGISVEEKSKRVSDIAQKRLSIQAVGDHIEFSKETKSTDKDRTRSATLLKESVELDHKAQATNSKPKQAAFRAESTKRKEQYATLVEEMTLKSEGIPYYKIDGKRVEKEEFNQYIDKNGAKIKEGTLNADFEVVNDTNAEKRLNTLGKKNKAEQLPKESSPTQAETVVVTPGAGVPKVSLPTTSEGGDVVTGGETVTTASVVFDGSGSKAIAADLEVGDIFENGKDGTYTIDKDVDGDPVAVDSDGQVAFKIDDFTIDNINNPDRDATIKRAGATEIKTKKPKTKTTTKSTKLGAKDFAPIELDIPTKKNPERKIPYARNKKGEWVILNKDGKPSKQKVGESRANQLTKLEAERNEPESVSKNLQPTSQDINGQAKQIDDLGFTTAQTKSGKAKAKKEKDGSSKVAKALAFIANRLTGLKGSSFAEAVPLVGKTTPESIQGRADAKTSVDNQSPQTIDDAVNEINSLVDTMRSMLPIIDSNIKKAKKPAEKKKLQDQKRKIQKLILEHSTDTKIKKRYSREATTEKIPEKLPETISHGLSSILDNKQLKGKTGGLVSTGILKQIGSSKQTQPIQQDIINEVLGIEKFQGKKKIDYVDFLQEINDRLLPLEVIESDSYKSYGKNNTGLENVVGDDQTKTHIYNTSLEHGVTGHFTGDFPSAPKTVGEITPRDRVYYKRVGPETFSILDRTGQVRQEALDITSLEGSSETLIKTVSDLDIGQKVPVVIYGFSNEESHIRIRTAALDNKGSLTGVNEVSKQEAVKILLDKLDASGSKTVKLTIKPLQGNFAVVRSDVVLTQENLQDNVLTVASTKEKAQEYIDNIIKAESTNKGMFGHTRVWNDGEGNVYIAEIQSDSYQKAKAKELLWDSYKKDPSTMNKKQKELLGKRDLDELYQSQSRVAALGKLLDRYETISFGDTRKLNEEYLDSGKITVLSEFTKPFTIEEYTEKDQKRYKAIASNGKEISSIPIDRVSKKDYNKRIENRLEGGLMPFGWVLSLDENGKYYAENFALENSMQTVKTDKKNTKEEVFDELYPKSGVDTKSLKINYNNGDVGFFDEIGHTIPERGLRGELKKDTEILDAVFDNASTKDKQFLAHEKNYTERLLREEVKRAADNGEKTVSIPTPRTLALIEGYIRKPKGPVGSTVAPYTVTRNGVEVSEDELGLGGDEVRYLDADYIIINSVFDTVRVVPKKNFLTMSTEGTLRYIESLGIDFDLSENDLEDLPSFFRKNVRSLMESDRSKVTAIQKDHGGWFDWEYVILESITGSETLAQRNLNRGSDISSFKISSMTKSEQTVLKKYEKLVKKFTKERGNTAIKEDSVGNEWVETKISEVDSDPTIVFSRDTDGSGDAQYYAAVVQGLESDILLSLSDAPGPSAFIHEVAGHVMERFYTPEQKQFITDQYNKWAEQNGQPSVENFNDTVDVEGFKNEPVVSEWLARVAEEYYKAGRDLNKVAMADSMNAKEKGLLQQALDTLSEAIQAIGQGIKQYLGSDVNLTPEMQVFFDEQIIGNEQIQNTGTGQDSGTDTGVPNGKTGSTSSKSSGSTQSGTDGTSSEESKKAKIKRDEALEDLETDLDLTTAIDNSHAEELKEVAKFREELTFDFSGKVLDAIRKKYKDERKEIRKKYDTLTKGSKVSKDIKEAKQELQDVRDKYLEQHDLSEDNEMFDSTLDEAYVKTRLDSHGLPTDSEVKEVSINELREVFYSNKGGGFYDKLFEKLLEIVKDNTQYFLIDGKSNDGTVGWSTYGYIALPTLGQTKSTIIHELLHAAVLPQQNRVESTSKAGIKFADQMKEDYERFKSLSSKKDLYGFTNEFEFAAEVISNPQFAEEVRRLEILENRDGDSFIKNIINNTLNYIKSLLGNKNQFPETVSKKVVENYLDKVNEAKKNKSQNYKNFSNKSEALKNKITKLEEVQKQEIRVIKTEEINKRYEKEIGKESKTPATKKQNKKVTELLGDKVAMLEYIKNKKLGIKKC